MAAALAAIPNIPDRRLRQQALVSSLDILCRSDRDRARVLMMQYLDLFPPGGQTPLFNQYESGETTCDLLRSLPPGHCLPARSRRICWRTC